MRHLSLVSMSLLFVLGMACQRSSEPAESSSEIEPLPTTDIYSVPGLGKFYLPYKNDAIQKTLRKGAVWEKKNIAVFEAFIRPGETVVDAGAYIGSHTIKFAQLARPGKTHAFEPQEDIFRILSHNIELNDLGEFAIAHRMALGDRSCNTRMNRNPKSSDPEKFRNRGANRVVGCLDDAGEPLSFEMRTLDSLELDNVSFIKIDVEGSEMMVLKGAERTIRKNKPVMLIEIGGGAGHEFTHHAATTRGEVIQWLEGVGYRTLRWHASDHLAIPVDR